jgi:polysaccharide biosynthesis/export protein
LGVIQAQGQTTEQLRVKIQQLLAVKQIVRDPELVVSLAELRPIYIGGNVVKPGEFSFKPGLTVRKALAMAGGLGTAESRTLAALIEFSTAKAEVGETSISIAVQRLRIARINAELNDDPEVKFGDRDPSIRPELWGALRNAEAAQFTAHQSERDRQRQYFERTLKVVQTEVEFLKKAEEEQQQQLTQQISDAARIHDMLQRGISTIARAEDEQRAIATIRWQILDVQARAQTAEREMETLRKEAENFEGERRNKLFSALQDATASATTLSYRLASAREKVRYAGGSSKTEAKPRVVIYRNLDGTQREIDANEESVLAPGDVLEVVVPEILG